MKNSTASNVAVSLAGALAETVADYEARLDAAKKSIDAITQLLKSDHDERAKAQSLMNRLMQWRADDTQEIGIEPLSSISRLLHEVLEAWPWPLPNPTPRSNPSG